MLIVYITPDKKFISIYWEKKFDEKFKIKLDSKINYQNSFLKTPKSKKINIYMLQSSDNMLNKRIMENLSSNLNSEKTKYENDYFFSNNNFIKEKREKNSFLKDKNYNNILESHSNSYKINIMNSKNSYEEKNNNVKYFEKIDKKNYGSNLKFKAKAY